MNSIVDAERLLAEARDARRFAYAPYSGFSVGAALLDSQGRIHRGVNVENAAYGLSTCAERTALVRAVAEGQRSFIAIAVVGPDGGAACMPCGACRQVLHEMAPDLQVVVESSAGGHRAIPLAELLPEAFDVKALSRPQPRDQ